MIARFLANLATRPGKAPLFDNPDNYGLAYEDVVFKAQDGVEISGWLINPGQDKVIIQSHFGLFCSRAGYTNEGKGLMKGWPTDINFLKHIKVFADAGYTVLAYDLRNHGESAEGTCPWICDGQEEYKDVLAAVGYITGHDDYKDAPIGMLDICMGSTSMVLAHGIDGGLEHVPNIKAHVVVQPLYSGTWFRQLKVPEFLIRRAVKVSVDRGGANFDKSPIDCVKLINAPTRVIQNKNDPMADHEYVQAFFDELRVEKDLVWTDLKASRAAGYADLGDHPETVLTWFDQYL